MIKKSFLLPFLLAGLFIGGAMLPSRADAQRDVTPTIEVAAQPVAAPAALAVASAPALSWRREPALTLIFPPASRRRETTEALHPACGMPADPAPVSFLLDEVCPRLAGMIHRLEGGNRGSAERSPQRPARPRRPRRA